MKIYDIGCFGIVVKVNDDGAGSITSDIAADDAPFGVSAVAWSGAIDAIESMILAHACAGIDIADTAYMDGVRDALESVGNHLA